jgi:hypothetical protein
MRWRGRGDREITPHFGLFRRSILQVSLDYVACDGGQSQWRRSYRSFDLGLILTTE